MIADIYILLPYPFHRRGGEALPAWRFTRGPYAVELFPPVQSTLRAAGKSRADLRAVDVAEMARPAVVECASADLYLDDVPVVISDLVQVRFRRETFERSRTVVDANGGPVDPPFSVGVEIANEFLMRARAVLGAAGLLPLLERQAIALLEYLDDAGNPVPADGVHFRGCSRYEGTQALNPLTADVCAAVHALPQAYEQPVWDVLLLDAVAAVANVGPAMVLAAAALETLIAQALEVLAPRSSVPLELWAWLNKRGDFRKEPSVEDQYDTLLKVTGGRSLKDRPDLRTADGSRDLE